MEVEEVSKGDRPSVLLDPCNKKPTKVYTHSPPQHQSYRIPPPSPLLFVWQRRRRRKAPSQKLPHHPQSAARRRPRMHGSTSWSGRGEAVALRHGSFECSLGGYCTCHATSQPLTRVTSTTASACDKKCLFLICTNRRSDSAPRNAKWSKHNGRPSV